MEKKNKQMTSERVKKSRKVHPDKKNMDKNAHPEGPAKENKRNNQWDKKDEGPGHKDVDAEMDDNSEE